MQTEFEFSLPRGFIGADGQIHKHGRMRLATGIDEASCIQHPRVQANEAYLPILLLTKVVTNLGTLERVTLAVVEGLFVCDIDYLQNLYLYLNSQPDLIAHNYSGSEIILEDNHESEQ